MFELVENSPIENLRFAAVLVRLEYGYGNDSENETVRETVRWTICGGQAPFSMEASERNVEESKTRSDPRIGEIAEGLGTIKKSTSHRYVIRESFKSVFKVPAGAMFNQDARASWLNTQLSFHYSNNLNNAEHSLTSPCCVLLLC